MTNDYKWNDHVAEAIIETHKYYEEHKYDTVETRIVKFADIIQALNYTLSEVQIWNSTMIEVLQEIIIALNKNFGNDEILKNYIPTTEDIQAENNINYTKFN